MEAVKAIETFYNGYRFRSRLEARWAVFFDSLNVEYEYEPEGYRLQDGSCYLPDFRVKCYGMRGIRNWDPFDLFIEVKGKPNLNDAKKIKLFSGTDLKDGYGLVQTPILVVGNIPKLDESYNCDYFDEETGLSFFSYVYIDGDEFGAYPAAHKGKFYLWGADGNYINNDDIADVEKAYANARQARFEHGENPLAKKKKRSGIDAVRDELYEDLRKIASTYGTEEDRYRNRYIAMMHIFVMGDSLPAYKHFSNLPFHPVKVTVNGAVIGFKCELNPDKFISMEEINKWLNLRL